MSRPWRGRGGAGQLAVLAVDERDRLPVDHLAWDVLKLVDELDLSAFEAAYRADGRGRPPYDPKMMLALIVYGRSKKLFSGRELAAACYDDLGARVITGNQYPDRSVLDRFLSTHGPAMCQLLVQTLRLGAAEGLVDVGVVAGDGTKVRASAAKSASVSEPDLIAEIAALQEQVTGAQVRWSRQVSSEHTHGSKVKPYGDYLFDDSTFTAALAEPAAHEDAPGEVKSAEKIWRELTALTVKLRARQSALAHLQTHPGPALSDWAERVARHEQRLAHADEKLCQTRADLRAIAERRAGAQAAGKKFSGTRPVPVEDHTRMRRLKETRAGVLARLETARAARPITKVNTTDPGSRIMPGKHGGFAQHYNVQALACKNQFILAIGTHDSANDKQALTALLENTRANLDAAAITDPIRVALFDNGYASDANFTAPLPVDTLLIAVAGQEHQTQHTPSANIETSTTTTENSGSSRKIGGDSPAWHIMDQRLSDPANRALYKRRAAIIEPLFAQLFTRFGRTLNLRGNDVQTELHLWALTHNLLKITRHRRKTPPPG
jgi:transposase